MPTFALHVYDGSEDRTHVMVGDDEHFALPPGARVHLAVDGDRVNFVLLKTDPDSGQDVVMDRWWRAFRVRR
jgi:hypothetical protein